MYQYYKHIILINVNFCTTSFQKMCTFFLLFRSTGTATCGGSIIKFDELNVSATRVFKSASVSNHTVADLIVNKITAETVDMTKIRDVDLCENRQKALTVQHKSQKRKVCALNGCSSLGEKDRRVSLEMSEHVFLNTREHVLAGDAMCHKHRQQFSTLKETGRSAPTQLYAPKQSTVALTEVSGQGVPAGVSLAHGQMPGSSSSSPQLSSPSQIPSAPVGESGHGPLAGLTLAQGPVPSSSTSLQFSSPSQTPSAPMGVFGHSPPAGVTLAHGQVAGSSTSPQFSSPSQTPSAPVGEFGHGPLAGVTLAHGPVPGSITSPQFSASSQTTSALMGVSGQCLAPGVTLPHGHVADSSSHPQLSAPSETTSALMEVSGQVVPPGVAQAHGQVAGSSSSRHGLPPPQVTPVHGQLPASSAPTQLFDASENILTLMDVSVDNVYPLVTLPCRGLVTMVILM